MLTSPINQTFKMYNGTVELVYNDKGHKYQVNGSEVMGVTGALSVIAKPALMQWAVNEALSYVRAQVLPGIGYDEIQLNAILTKAKLAHRARKEEAADFGTLVHNWIENYIKGKKPGPLVNPLLNQAVRIFTNWAEQNKVTFTDSERIIYSKKHNYAGKCDFLCEIEGQKYLGDIKTSNSIYDEYGLQVSAYRLALEEETGVKYDGMMIIRVPKKEDDRVEIAYVNNYEKNARAFLMALYLKAHFNILQANKRGGEIT